MGYSKNRQIWLFHRNLQSEDLLLINICSFYGIGSQIVSVYLLSSGEAECGVSLHNLVGYICFQPKTGYGKAYGKEEKDQPDLP